MEFTRNQGTQLLLLMVISISVSVAGAQSNSPPRPATILDPEIEKVCNATQFPKICKESIVPYLNGKTDPASVLAMEMNAGIENTECAITIAKDAMKGPSSNADGLQVCLKSYDSVVNSWKNALGSLKDRKGSDVANHLTAISSTIMGCENTFTGGDPKNSPLIMIDRRILRINTNCFNIHKMVFPSY